METVTAAEHAVGRLDSAKLDRLKTQFDHQGFVVLANVVPDHSVLAGLEDACDLVAAVRLLGEHHTSSTQLGPLLPRCAPWVRPEIISNPISEQLVAHLLVGEAFIRWHGSNTALPRPPGSQRLSEEKLTGWAALPDEGIQHLHMDGWGWSVVSGRVHPTYKIFCNYALSDMTPERGSTQIWPASNTVVPSAAGMPCNVQQIDVSTMGPIIKDRAANRATAPVQVVVPRGGAIFRDLRCWHRGMPNFSTMPRHMLGVAYGAVRDPGAETSALGKGIHNHVFSSSCKTAFQVAPGAPLIRRNIAFVAELVDSGGKTPDEEGYFLPLAVGRENSPTKVLAPLIMRREDRESLPWWVHELAAGKRLERERVISRM